MTINPRITQGGKVYILYSFSHLIYKILDFPDYLLVVYFFFVSPFDRENSKYLATKLLLKVSVGPA